MIKGLVALSVFLLFVLAFGGFLGGFALLADPTGALVGFPDNMIDRLPVSTYTWPAVFLVVVFGMAPAYTGLRMSRALFSDSQLFPNIMAMLSISVIYLGWLSLQIYLLGWGHYIQTLAVVLCILLLLTGLILYISTNQPER